VAKIVDKLQKIRALKRAREAAGVRSAYIRLHSTFVSSVAIVGLSADQLGSLQMFHWSAT
jgi:hypothetical protein